MITLLQPQAGPILGNTSVLLSVQNLSEPFLSSATLECRFGNMTPVAATIGNTTEESRQVRCVSPPMPRGEAPLFLSLNQQDYRLVGSANFTAYTTPTILSLSPTGGPLHGQTAVSFSGSGLVVPTVDVSEAQCRFGRHAVPAALTPGGFASCVAPSAAEA
eukprot:4361604-Prymnesium_polylepis.1